MHNHLGRLEPTYGIFQHFLNRMNNKSNDPSIFSFNNHKNWSQFSLIGPMSQRSLTSMKDIDFCLKRKTIEVFRMETYYQTYDAQETFQMGCNKGGVIKGGLIQGM